jgi:hypothetical protein
MKANVSQVMSAPRIRHERDLLSIAPKNPADYEDVSLTALTMYSLYWLHEWELRRTIEAVAVLNWRLFPNKFAMVGWPQYPDAFRTNRSLLQGQPKYRNWLTGTASKGFSLNDRGIQIAVDLINRLGPPATTEGQVLSSGNTINGTLSHATARARSVEPAREVERARSSRLFEKWKSGVMAERDLIHVHALLGIFEHTPAKAREKKMKDLERCSRDINDKEMLRFLADVRRNYPAVFQ